jgi:protein-tyrosine-phosphatase
MADVNILFVCTGNTCRSPMAEGLFRKAAEGKGYQVSSAGVAAYEGAPASRETVEILQEKGIALDGFGSRMVNEEILAETTHVFCLTSGHRDSLQQHFPEMADKLFLVAEFAEIEGQVGRDISDPIGCGQSAYEEVARQLEQSIAGILGFLEVK